METRDKAFVFKIRQAPKCKFDRSGGGSLIFNTGFREATEEEKKIKTMLHGDTSIPQIFGLASQEETDAYWEQKRKDYPEEYTAHQDKNCDCNY